MAYAFLFSLVSIIYGSLMPFAFTPRPFTEAWAAFLKLPILDIGVGGRADWIANIVLYVPLGLTAAGLAQGRRRLSVGTLCLMLLAFTFCAVVAVVIEFLQLYFQPRTVSANDIIAELIGSLIGLSLWPLGRSAITGLRTAFVAGGGAATRALIGAYALAYLALSFFPYDVLISQSEIDWKLTTRMYHPLLVRSHGQDDLRMIAKLIGETLAVVPFGIFLGMSRQTPLCRGVVTAIAAGAGLGIAIETLQFFLASGISQGASVLTRAVGVAAGSLLSRAWETNALAHLRPYTRPAVALAAVPYVVLLAGLNGWFRGSRPSVTGGIELIRHVNYLPFYYHYFSSEPVALASVVLHTAMYLPIGLGYWVWSLERPGPSPGARVLIPALWAALVAVVMEAGKAFLWGRHPDPTDVLIAAGAAAGAFAGGAALSSLQGREAIAPPSAAEDSLPIRPAGGTNGAAAGEQGRHGVSGVHGCAQRWPSCPGSTLPGSGSSSTGESKPTAS